MPLRIIIPNYLDDLVVTDMDMAREASDIGGLPGCLFKWEIRFRPTPDFQLWCESNLSHPFEFHEEKNGLSLVGHEDDIILVRMRF